MAGRSSQSTVLARVGKSSNEPRESERRPSVHLVDLGEGSPGAIRDLKDGRGRLLDDVAEAIQQIEAMLGTSAAGTTILPLVVIVEKKRKRRDMGMFPFRMMMP